MQDQILTVEQLGALIHKSPASIRSDASRKPGVLPPICRLPGNKRLLWRREDVLAWVEGFVQRSPSVAMPSISPVPAVPKKRGRPRKTSSAGANR
jgi:hypothetical protein